MAYSRTNWVQEETQLNATNMNNIEEGIAEAFEGASVVAAKIAGVTKAEIDLLAGKTESNLTKITPLTVSIAASAWTGITATVTVTGVTTSNTVIVSPAPSSILTWAELGIKCTTQAVNSLTFACTSAPTSAVSVNVLIIG